MAVHFTEDQRKVIDSRNQSLLVSAAAGSGKTAVLVERILRLVTDPERPVDIDRILVVTFTNAAAAQMKEKILAALEKELAQCPENEHLQKQVTLVHHAQICTIDSFCLYVLRNNFHEIGLEPGFRIADEGEVKLLMQDTLETLLEEWYQRGEEDFLELSEGFGADRKDTGVESAILQLFRTADSAPWPEEWLESHRNDYCLEEGEELFSLPWYGVIRSMVRSELEMCILKLERCISVTEESDGPYMYADLLVREKEAMEGLLRRYDESESYENDRNDIVSGVPFARLPSKKDESVDPNKRELVKAIRNGVKDTLTKIRKRYYLRDEASLRNQMERSHRIVDCLCRLTLDFYRKLAFAKEEKGILDFSDIEHLALQVLINKDEDGNPIPAKAAREYRDYYACVMIDEYQDSNRVQEYILSVISGEEDGRYNRFMVGDVKQSIYRFRQACPELFQEKAAIYSPEGETQLRVDLHKNFRSRKQVLDTVNGFFYRLMRKELGGICYDDLAALHLGAGYTCVDDPAFDSELLLVSSAAAEDDDEHFDDGSKDRLNNGWDDGSGDDSNDAEGPELGKVELEALGVARRIKEMISEGQQVTDEASPEKLRPVGYGDIVILLRSLSGTDEVYARIFREQGIPLYVPARSGYFGTYEIRMMLHLLRIIANPLQDIPFYGVLTSCIGGISDEEAARIRSTCKGRPYFYQNVVDYISHCETMEGGVIENTQEAKLYKKLKVFYDFLQTAREESVYMPIHELLRKLMNRTGFRDKMTAMVGGAQRNANLDMLLQKASEFERTSYYGLHHFIRYMEQLERYEVDYGEASVTGAGSDAVQIMSIHKSKGLEFPVCIVSGLSKGFNTTDTRGKLLIDADDGIGIQLVDSSRRTKTDTLRKNYLAEKMKRDMLAEELRVLYVALTRAKEKLILVGTVNDPEKTFRQIESSTFFRDGRMSLDSLVRSKSMLEWILGALQETEEWKLFRAERGEIEAIEGSREPEADSCKVLGKIRILTTAEAEREETADQIEREVLKAELEEPLLTKEGDPASTFAEKIRQKLEYSYPYEELRTLPVKVSVSELKMNAMEETDEAAHELFRAREEKGERVPAFLGGEEKISAVNRGNAYHRFMELFDFKALTEYNLTEYATLLQQEKERMIRLGLISEEYVSALSDDRLLAFLSAPVALRMARADRKGLLRREQPFMIGVDSSALGADAPAGETLLVQGIIDVFWEEEGKSILLDYKTDRVAQAEELIERYRAQLDYYSDALSRIYLPNEEKLIYSFALGETIRI